MMWYTWCKTLLGAFSDREASRLARVDTSSIASRTNEVAAVLVVAVVLQKPSILAAFERLPDKHAAGAEQQRGQLWNDLPERPEDASQLARHAKMRIELRGHLGCRLRSSRGPAEFELSGSSRDLDALAALSVGRAVAKETKRRPSSTPGVQAAGLLEELSKIS